MRVVMMLGAALALGGCSDHGKGGGGGTDAGPVDAPKVSPIDAPFFFDGPSPDAPVIQGSAPLTAWTESAPNTYTAATLDLSCLGVARTSPPTTTNVTLVVSVHDWQSGDPVPGVEIQASPSNAPATVLAVGTTGGNGASNLNIPSGTARFGMVLIESNSRSTFVLDRILAPSTAAQGMDIQILSNATAATLPALIGESAAPATSIELGRITDCQGHFLAGATATVSSSSTAMTPLTGAETYYFSDAVGLPVRHTQAAATEKDGRFMIIDLPATQTAFVQVWGFRTAAELSAGTPTKIAQLAIAVPTNGAIMTTHDPRATQ